MTSINGNPQPRKPWLALGFSTKGAWRLRLKAILHSTPIGHEISGDDHRVIMAALANHPESQEKVGSGVHHFEVGPGPDKFGSSCFHLVRLDGSRITFSIKTCLDGRVGPWTAFCYALRDAVSLEMLEWKNHNGGPCELCGSTSDRQVDHRYPKTFNFLAKEFAEERGIEPTEVKFQDDPMWKLADAGLSSLWIQYHREHADLRILCGSCNSRIGARSAA